VADLALWRKLVDDAQRRLPEPCEALDLGSGNGRVSLAIARDSCHVTALDLDRELLEVTTSRARAAGAPIDPVQGDVRSFELGKRFDLVIAPMQLVQMLRSEQERHSMLDCVARHLEPGGKAAFALLELDEQWAATEEQAPVPDMREVAGWLYSSQPVAVRRIQGGATLELDRVRRVVSPTGDLSESFSRVHLQLLSPHQLRGEASHTGLRQHSIRTVPPTEIHMASTVVILERRG
jgi:SAM-dependent methyltransferase